MDLTVQTYAHTQGMEKTASWNVVVPSHYAAMLTGAILQIKVCILWVERVQNWVNWSTNSKRHGIFVWSFKMVLTPPEIYLICVGLYKDYIMLFSLSCWTAWYLLEIFLPFYVCIIIRKKHEGVFFKKVFSGRE